MSKLWLLEYFPGNSCYPLEASREETSKSNRIRLFSYARKREEKRKRKEGKREKERERERKKREADRRTGDIQTKGRIDRLTDTIVYRVALLL